MARFRPLLLTLGALTAGLACAHIRLHTSSFGTKLRWSSPQNVSIVINSTGSDNLSDDSHFTAIRNGIDAWNAVSDATIQLAENTDPVQQARTDWGATGLHLVIFDENNTSGYFPGSSGTVAITPVLFNSGNGNILDADVIYNGKNFNFTTSGEPGRFDVQDVGTHELGHFLGLDHTGWAGGTMFPYVSPTIIAHRSLSIDEENGMRDAYPAGSLGAITGTVRRASDNSTISGAHVTCVDALTGRSAAGTLANQVGVFTIDGLPDGTYRLIANPLKGVVDETNLQSGPTIETDFDATVGTTIVVTAGATASYGDLVADDPVVSQVQDVILGTAGTGLPLRVVRGTNNTNLMVGGNALNPGSTLSVSDPDMTLSNVVFGGSAVNFALDVPSNEATGHVDLLVTTANGSAILPAAIEIVPPSPTVSTVTPSLGSSSGGTDVTITGTNFQPGARVVLGTQIYRDGDPGVAVVDATTITLATAATAAGTYDAVVIDPSGVEGRKANAYQFSFVPAIASVFPPAGSVAGGTEVLVSGQDFVLGATVEIDGVPQSQVTVEDATTLRVVTEAKGSPLAGAVLRVIVPGGAFADSAFTYTTQPDPVVTALSPTKGPTSGGTTVTISGGNFTADSQVQFGVAPDGSGGTAAATVTFVDANTLAVTTPAFTQGNVSLLVQDPSTGQADIVEAAFGFQSGSSGGGGGGGCYTEVVGGGPPRAREILAGTWWLLALIGGLAWQRSRAARQTPVSVRIGRASD